VGKESFFSACQSPDCQGIGRCGLCWCNLAIPSLNVKRKDMINIPNLVALALQADGWWIRSDIIWHKLNPMPESVTDRPTKAHEYLFLLSKSERYYYDADAIKEPIAEKPLMTVKGVSLAAISAASGR
jgi:DNA modification methylase